MALFSGKDVLEMAVLIEQRGAEFYRKAAALARSEEQQTFFQDLADMEEQHSRIFSELLDKAKADVKDAAASSEDAYFNYVQQELNSQRETPQRAQAEAFMSKTLLSQSPDTVAATSRTLIGLAETAIGMEKDSIVFYLSLRQNCANGLEKDQVDMVIAEELRHVRLLSQFLEQLRKEAN